MENKSAVSALQEFSAKSKVCPPTYDFIDGEDGGYVCKVQMMEIESYGNGRSKRDAKHLAAANILRKIRKLPGAASLLNDVEINECDGIGELANEMTNLNRDMLKELRDYCVRHEMPLPIIEIVQQSGTPNAPEFVACCSVASIVRYGKSDKKKDARQRAAIEMMAVISNDLDALRPDQMQMVTTKPSEVNDVIEDVETERRKKFTTYRELTDAGITDNTGLRLCDRHNYFKNFYPALKEAAFEVINSDEYMNTKDQALSLLSALKITPTIGVVESTSIEPLMKIELNCELDCLFLGFESEIFGKLIEYFKDMLV
ncbi:RISC-loading complex subunit tarbp2 [Drosophila kikkawai]|uniref:RISC-loading complex subunit tarbp2 n=1 Tax=Drosophila kikkawai TaxID=30033 RepID=A0A6P4IKF1_DROKI|nr:uncharacterized protein LOC108079613 [Drosophila kikkawai]